MRRSRLALQRLMPLNHYTTKASPKMDAQVVYITSSDIADLGEHATFVVSTPTAVEIFIWIMSPLLSQRQVSMLQTERNIMILHIRLEAYSLLRH